MVFVSFTLVKTLIQKTAEARRLRPYAPEGLMVLRGPGERYGEGSRWTLADGHGFAEVELMRGSESLRPGTLYVENLEVKREDRGMGHGEALFLRVQGFARNVGALWMQIDSERDAVGFWLRVGFEETGRTFYGGKVSMIKRVPGR
jgi:ribosomal protein S18 acetylase RimI-like enzyme